MPLGYCKVRVNITALVKDGNDSDTAPDDEALSGKLKLVPMVKEGTPLQYDDAGRKKLKVLTAIEDITIGPMGDIVNGPLDFVTVPAPDSSNTNLASLQWQAIFVQPKYGSKLVKINDIFFYAVAGVDIDLADEINTAPSSTAVQITRGPRGFGVVDVQTEDAELVFYAGPPGDPAAWLEAGRAPVPTAAVSNTAVAPLVENTGPTRAAVDARVKAVGDITYALKGSGGGAAIPPDLDALAKLDFRTNAPVTVAIAADSTVGFSPEKWYQLGWKELMAELWPERAAECIAWNPTPDAYDPPITWQLGSGGSGTEVQTIGQDTFTRTGALAASAPTVGNGTWLTTGGSAAATNGTRLVRTTTTPILTAQFQLKPRIGLDGTWGGKLYMASNLGVGSNTIMYGPYVTSQNFIRLLFTVSAAGVTKIEVRKTIGGTNTLIGSFPLQTWPDNSAATELAFSINVTGTALTCTVNGATVPGTLTAGDVTALTSADQNFSFSTEHTAFEMDDLLVTGNVSAAGGSSLPKTTVYNAAVGGSTAAYQLARLNAMYPVRPDLMFLSHGHNYGSSVTTANFLAAIDEFMSAFLAKYPGVPIVVFSQNPRFAPATNLESHGDKQRALRAYAVSKGWHYIADYEAWEARPDRGSALMSVDGIHPAQPAGGRFGADQLKKWVKARSARVVV